MRKTTRSSSVTKSKTRSSIKRKRKETVQPLIDVNLHEKEMDILHRFDDFQKDLQLTQQAVAEKWCTILSNNFIDDSKEILKKTNESYVRQIDKCDAIIALLQNFIREGESQYQFSIVSYEQNLENFIQVAKNRLSFERQRFLGILNSSYDENSKNTNRFINSWCTHYQKQRDIDSSIEREYEQFTNLISAKNSLEHETIKSSGYELIASIRGFLVSEIRAMKDQTQEANDDFKKKTEGKMQQFNQLFDEHKERVKQMKKNELLILRNAKEISHWRRKLRINEQESKRSNDALRQEKENLSLHFRELKDMISKFRQLERGKLAEISVLFEEVDQSLTKHLTVTENVLKYSEMTRDLEFEIENITPFRHFDDQELQSHMEKFKAQALEQDKFVKEADLFEDFYRRLNKVVLDKITLEKRREFLLERNVKLKYMLKKFISGVEVQENTFQNSNTLLIVNMQTNAPRPAYTEDHIPIKDLPLVAHTIQLQTQGISNIMKPNFKKKGITAFRKP